MAVRRISRAGRKFTSVVEAYIQRARTASGAMTVLNDFERANDMSARFCRSSIEPYLSARRYDPSMSFSYLLTILLHGLYTLEISEAAKFIATQINGIATICDVESNDEAKRLSSYFRKDTITLMFLY